ncbi:MAG: YdcH family protein [Burkholderiales bacterium]
MTVELSDEEAVLIRRKIVALKVEHRDLDEVIARLSSDYRQDELQMRRLKRRKLLLKDQITLLEGQLVPDIPA